MYYAKNPSDFHLNETPTKQVEHTKKRTNPITMDATKIINTDNARKVVVPAIGFVTGAAASSMLNKAIAPRLGNINLQRAARILIPVVGGMITLGMKKGEFTKRVAYGMGITAVYEGIGVLNEVLGSKIPFISQVNATVNPSGNTDTQVSGWVQPTMPQLSAPIATTSRFSGGADVAELTNSTIEEV